MSGPVHAFGEFELDETLYELRRGKTSIPIEPKVFDVVVYLLRNRDRVVPKQELLRELWPPSVSPSVLPRCIREARRCLGDDADEQAIVQTVRGRGYRFVAAVEEDPRRAALEELRRLQSRVHQGHGGVVAVLGPAAAGKTACIEAFIGELDDASLVLRGRASHRDDQPAFWPWIQVLREAVDRLDGLEDRSEPSEPGTSPSPPLPPLSLPDLSALRPADLGPGPPQARFGLHDAIGQFLRALAERQPVVVVVEDAQWLDHESRQLLLHLGTTVGASAVLIVVTARDEPSLEPLWTELEREPSFARTRLEPVSAPGPVE